MGNGLVNSPLDSKSRSSDPAVPFAFIRVESHPHASQTTIPLTSPIVRGLKWGAVATALGSVFAVYALVLWIHHGSSLNYYQTQNRSLKRELSAGLANLAEIRDKVQAIRNNELALREQYGLLDAELKADYAVGGRKSLRNLFIELTDPLQQTFIDLERTQDWLEFTSERTKAGFVNLRDYIGFQKALWNHQPTIAPADGRITSGFGMRMHPLYGIILPHQGIDIGGEKWNPIYASADGTVVGSGHSESFGRYVTLDHGNGYRTRYGHLLQTAVEKGKLVRRYELIGYMGSSGISTGPHLHYEVHRDNQPRDPEQFILPTGVLVD